MSAPTVVAPPRTMPTPMLPSLNLPRTIFAMGAVDALADELTSLGVRRPMLVTDRRLVDAGVAALAIRSCGGLDAMVVFDGVTENPLFADVDRGAAMYAAHGCDGVVAVGGGSVIDTAKIIALLGTNPGHVAQYVGVPNVFHVAAAPLIVIPTTAGTGSEASPSAGIHPDASTASLGMGSRHLVPRVAILDPQMTRSLPSRLAAATGVDALSHCIEGYLSKKSIPMADAIALDGVARVARSLRRAVADPADDEARGDMMLAAYAGGTAIGMGLGPAHAIAIVCGDQGLHHGMLSGIGVVATLDATAARVPERVADLARAFGLDPGASMSEAVGSLMRELGLPASLAEIGYQSGDIDALALAAHESYFNALAPHHPSQAEYAAMIGRSLAPR